MAATEISTAQVGRILGISTEEVRNLIMKGKLEARRPHPFAPWLVSCASVDAKNRVEAARKK